MRDRDIRYMVIGAGGTGGAVGSHLARAGCRVTFIARGRSSEIDGLIYEVQRLADEYGVKLPLYNNVVNKLREAD